MRRTLITPSGCRVVAPILGLVPLLAGAQESSSSVAPGPAVGIGMGDTLTVLLGLAAVVGLIFAFSWVVRRFNGGTTIKGRLIKVLAVTPLGAKEKLVLAQVGDRQVLLGVTAHQVTPLLELDEPIITDAHPEGSPFAQQLGALVRGKQASANRQSRSGSSQQ